MKEITVYVTVESLTRLESGLYQVKAFYGTPPVMSRSADGSLERIRAEDRRKTAAYEGVTSLFFPANVGLCPKIGEALVVKLSSVESEGISLTQDPSGLYGTEPPSVADPTEH